jgi:ferredoxin
MTRPNHKGVKAFCNICTKCAEACPVKALPFGAPQVGGSNASSIKGVRKWTSDAEKCFSFGVKHQSAAWFKCIVNSIALFAAHISTFFHDQMGPITGAQISVRYSAQRFGKLHSRIITFNNIQMF